MVYSVCMCVFICVSVCAYVCDIGGQRVMCVCDVYGCVCGMCDVCGCHCVCV